MKYLTTRLQPFILLLTLTATPATYAAIQSRAIEYKHGDTIMEGELFYDDGNTNAGRPGVLVVHEWWGLNDYARSRARQLAEMGYFAFAIDMYGKGVRAKNIAECQQFSGVLKADRKTMRGRINAALDTLRSQKGIDPAKIAAIGYCFGGTCALELARSGADVAGIVAFHAGLSTSSPAAAGNLKARILVCHGADDPFVPDKELLDFVNEMKSAKANYQVNVYGNAVHTFTNPAAGNDPSKGSAYNEQADRRSWEAMKDFFAEIFK